MKEHDYRLPVTSSEERHMGRASPHPDGKPWAKCCESAAIGLDHPGCAFRRDNHGCSGNHSRAEDHPELLNGEDRFFCIHRREDGHHRVCAGWHAWTKGLAIKEAKGERNG